MNLPYTYLGRMTPGLSLVFEIFGPIPQYIEISAIDLLLEIIKKVTRGTLFFWCRNDTYILPTRNWVAGPLDPSSFLRYWTYTPIYWTSWHWITSGIITKVTRGITLYFWCQNDLMTLPYTYLCHMTPGPSFAFKILDSYSHISNFLAFNYF